MAMGRTREVNLLIGIGLSLALGVTLYWITWFSAPSVLQSRTPDAPDYPIYVAFEQAFPLADAWLAAAALIGAIGLWKMRDWGFLFMLLAASAAIFLGLMDLLYGLEHGMFIPLTAESAIELMIVILLLLLGPIIIYLTWGQRRRLLE
jgi:hypothetical protein